MVGSIIRHGPHHFVVGENLLEVIAVLDFDGCAGTPGPRFLGLAWRPVLAVFLDEFRALPFANPSALVRRISPGTATTHRTQAGTTRLR
jgi:hypothetical protein